MTTYEILTIIISTFSLIITSILTIFIFIKNANLTKKQTELQEQVFKYQEKQDKLMNRINEKPYLESVFKLLYSTYNFIFSVLLICNMKEENLIITNLLNDTLKENNYIYDNFDFKFDVAISYTDGELSETICEIKGCLIDIEKDINRLVLISNGHLKQDNEFNFDNIKDSIQESCEQIGYTQKYIIKELKNILKTNINEDINKSI